MGWYFGFKGGIHSEECNIYILTGEVQYGAPNIFINEQYNRWFKQFRDQISLVLINTKYGNANFLNQFKGKFQDVADYIQSKKWKLWALLSMFYIW